MITKPHNPLFEGAAISATPTVQTRRVIDLEPVKTSLDPLTDFLVDGIESARDRALEAAKARVVELENARQTRNQLLEQLVTRTEIRVSDTPAQTLPPLEEVPRVRPVIDLAPILEEEGEIGEDEGKDVMYKREAEVGDPWPFAAQRRVLPALEVVPRVREVVDLEPNWNSGPTIDFSEQVDTDVANSLENVSETPLEALVTPSAGQGLPPLEIVPRNAFQASTNSNLAPKSLFFTITLTDLTQTDTHYVGTYTSQVDFREAITAIKSRIEVHFNDKKYYNSSWHSDFDCFELQFEEFNTRVAGKEEWNLVGEVYLCLDGDNGESRELVYQYIVAFADPDKWDHPDVEF